MLRSKHGEQVPRSLRGSRLRKIDLDPIVPSSHIRSSGTAPHMKVEERFPAEVIGAPAAILHSGPGPDLGQHCFEIGEAGDVDAAHAL
jgi:hypothetical protein